MTSTKLLEKICYIPIYDEDEHNDITDINTCCLYKGDLCEVYENEVSAIEKDLEQLEKYKSIEDIFRIYLIKSIELCKQVNIKKVVYIKDEWGTYPIKILDDLDIELFNHRLYKNFGGMYVSLDLYEYGQTWALTKEKLENDN